MSAANYGWVRLTSPVTSSVTLVNLDHVSHVLAQTNSGSGKHYLIVFFPSAPGSGSNQAVEYSTLADAQSARDAIYTLLDSQSVIRDV